jgi:hypothetical protein
MGLRDFVGFDGLIYPLVIQHCYGKWPAKIDDFPFERDFT